MTAVLCVGRLVACAVHAVVAFGAVPMTSRYGTYDRAMLRPLLQMGGWLSVSNVISPLMSYIDRFVLGLLASASAVAYYATPQELILRLGIIPTAVAAVLFPLFSAKAQSEDSASDLSDHVKRYSLVILAMMLPLTLILFFGAHPILSLWISPDFADKASGALQIMSVAALCSGLAQVPYTMLQGRGRADITAKLHLAEFPVYLALLFILVTYYGAIGAAWAWLARIAADMAILYFINARLIDRAVSPQAMRVQSAPHSDHGG
jgi:O-antigen/teichoic acid export membrane protein